MAVILSRRASPPPLRHTSSSSSSSQMCNSLSPYMRPEDVPSDPCKMFVGGISWLSTPESLRNYFSKFGEVAEVMIMKDPATRRSRGFGFVTFCNQIAVQQVLFYSLHELDGKIIEPKVAVPRKTNPKFSVKTRKIFVGGLSASTCLDDIKTYFEQFSKVEDAMLAYDKLTSRHRGFGFVTFDSEDVVDKICEIHFHEINGKMVESKKAMPRGDCGRNVYCDDFRHSGVHGDDGDCGGGGMLALFGQNSRFVPTSFNSANSRGGFFINNNNCCYSGSFISLPHFYQTVSNELGDEMFTATSSDHQMMMTATPLPVYQDPSGWYMQNHNNQTCLKDSEPALPTPQKQLGCNYEHEFPRLRTNDNDQKKLA